MMTWEIAVGFFTIVSAFTAVMNVVIKVNRTLTRLDDTVRQLKSFMERQSKKNEIFGETLTQHELRIARLEKEREAIK